MEKPVVWLGSALQDLRAFPAEARGIAGYQLFRLQQQAQPSDWKPMPSDGPGVEEIRVHTKLEHRILYVARFAEGVYVLHAFEKRSHKTSVRDLALARIRFRALLASRKRKDDAKERT